MATSNESSTSGGGSSIRPVQRILIGVDNSSATRSAVEHVVQMFPGDHKPTIALLHVLDQAAPSGYEAAASAMALDAGAMPAIPAMFDVDDAKLWAERAKREMEPFVETLTRHGWPEEAIERHAAIGGLTHGAVADVLAEQAKSLHADVVVVGREHHSALHEALLKTTGERLVHYCKGITVWVVGTEKGE